MDEARVGEHFVAPVGDGYEVRRRCANGSDRRIVLVPTLREAESAAIWRNRGKTHPKWECLKCGPIEDDAWGVVADAPGSGERHHKNCPAGYGIVRPYNPEPQQEFDPVERPAHYHSHPTGVECVAIAEHFGYHLGNVVAYIWRHKLKGAPIEDLKKARWHLDREIRNLENAERGAGN